jgi:hypothetical protein
MPGNPTRRQLLEFSRAQPTSPKYTVSTRGESRTVKVMPPLEIADVAAATPGTIAYLEKDERTYVGHTNRSQITFTLHTTCVTNAPVPARAHAHAKPRTYTDKTIDCPLYVYSYISLAFDATANIFAPACIISRNSSVYRPNDCRYRLYRRK